MSFSNNFRFLNEHVEEAARRTPAILSSESLNLWDDILEAYDHRDENRGYWLFATRWIRESLVEVMNRGSEGALRNILHTLRPDLGVLGSPVETMAKRTLVAHLLPLLMAESVAMVEAASMLRFGPSYQDAPPTYHPEDH